MKMEIHMNTNSNCYLCTAKASCEEVRGEHGEWIDVLCQGSCPRYLITDTAIKKLMNNKNRKNEIIYHINAINITGKISLIRYDSINNKFIFTSKEEQ